LMPLQRSNVAGRLKPFGQKKGHLHTSTIWRASLDDFTLQSKWEYYAYDHWHNMMIVQSMMSCLYKLYLSMIVKLMHRFAGSSCCFHIWIFWLGGLLIKKVTVNSLPCKALVTWSM
jgi:hypothetical protein